MYAALTIVIKVYFFETKLHFSQGGVDKVSRYKQDRPLYKDVQCHTALPNFFGFDANFARLGRLADAWMSWHDSVLFRRVR